MRKLAWASFGFAAAVFVSHYLLRGTLPLLFSLLALALLPLGLLLRGNARRRWLLCALAAALGFGWYGAYARWALSPLETLPDQAAVYIARVVEYPTRYEDSTALTLRLESPGLRRMKTRVYVYDDSCADLTPGDRVSVELKLRPGTLRYGEETDSNLARGVFLLGTVMSPPERLEPWRGSGLYLPQRIAHRLLGQAEALFPPDVSAFAQALMLGEKQRLYAENLDLPLRDAGILHAVAVSGMHLAFVLGAARLFFGARRRLALLSLPLLALFALMAGAAPSVLRAVCMVSLLLLAPVLERENDSATSLLFALALLLLCQPFSAGSAGLQLSFASMAGILGLSGPIYRDLIRRRYPAGQTPGRFAQGLFATLSATIASMASTLPLGALRFGMVSLAAPLTNLLVLWVLPAAFLGSWLSVLAGLLWAPLGRGLAWLAAWPLRYVLAVARGTALLPVLRYDASAPLTVLWLVFVYLIAAALILAHRQEKPVRLALPVCCAVLALLVVGLFSRWQGERVPRVSVLDVGQGQSLLFRAGKTSLLVDCGGTHAAENAGDIAARALLRERRESLDLLVLTHPHEDHINGARRLLLQIRVHELALPAAAASDSPEMEALLETARDRGTRVRLLGEDRALDLGALRLELFPELGVQEQDGSLLLRVRCGEFDTLVTGDADQAVEARLAEQYDLKDTELFIVGHHGSKYASGDALLDELGAEAAVISCGYNSYGHPAQETLDRLRRHGLTVWRTDQEGTVTIRME